MFGSNHPVLHKARAASQDCEKVTDFQWTVLLQICTVHCILDFVQTEFGPDGIGPQHASNFRVCWPSYFPDWVNRVGTIRICKLHGNEWPCIQPINKSGQLFNQSNLECTAVRAHLRWAGCQDSSLARLYGLARTTGRSPALQHRLVCQASIWCCHISLANAHSLGSMPAPLQLCTSWIYASKPWLRHPLLPCNCCCVLITRTKYMGSRPHT